jgi:putative endonuclease
MIWFVYFIKSLSDKWYYVGSTNDIVRRIAEHNAGRVSSTKSKRPLVLVYKKQFNTEQEARGYERLLKSKRIEKEKIIKEIENCPIV